MTPSSKKIPVAINGPAGPKVWLPENYLELSRDEVIRASGFFEGKLPLSTMILMSQGTINNYRPNSYYEIPTSDNNALLHFIVIQKNASTYVCGRLAIEGHGPQFRARSITDENRERRLIAQTVKHSPESPGTLINFEDEYSWSNSKKIIVVRNPISRVISSYCHVLYQPFGTPSSPRVMQAACITKKTQFWNTVFDDLSYKTMEQVDRSALPSPSVRQIVNSFIQFLGEIGVYGFYDEHMFPQVSFLTNLELTLRDVKYRILFEDIERGIDHLIETYSLPSTDHKDTYSLSRNESSQRIKKILNKFIEDRPQIVNKIARLYADDFDLYNEVKNENHFYS